MRIEGVWQDDRRFGMQVKVRVAEPVAPSGEEALIAYLKRVKHIGGGAGGAAAGALRRGRAGRDRRRPGARVPGGRARARSGSNEAIRSWNGLRSTRALHLLLAPHGLAWLVPRIAAEYGDRANEVVREPAVRADERVRGRLPDRGHDRARRRASRATRVGRTRAAVVHVLERGRARRLDVPAGARARRAAASCSAARRPTPRCCRTCPPPTSSCSRPTTTVGLGLPPADRRAGGRAAETVRRLAPREAAPARRRLAPPPPSSSPPPSSGRRSQAAFASRLSIVTGGPGTGKTATIRLICAAAKAQRASIALVAPTGRAARRMAESTGMDASTIHSALGWIPGQGPTKDEIEADLLVVDETSMANLELLVTLLRAVGRRDARRARRRRRPARAGRRRQAVRGAGRDARGAGAPSSRTSSARPPGSMIVRGAHAVKRGEPPSFEVARGPAARPLPDRARRPARGAGRDRLAGHAAPPAALRRGPADRHPGLRARLQGRARHRRASTRGCARR